MRAAHFVEDERTNERRQTQVIKHCGSRHGPTTMFQMIFLPLDKAVASIALFVIVSGSDGRTSGRRTETLSKPTT